MTKKTVLLALTFIMMSVASVNAQVIIGGDGIEDPHAGAILDLSPLGAKKLGLLLPRVELSDLNMLYPMFEGGYDPAENAKHTGLTVYNTAECPGVYLWTGTAWIKLGEPCIPPVAPMSMDGTFCSSGTVILTAAVGDGETVDWYDCEVGGEPLSNGVRTTTFTTPLLNATTDYYAEARNTTTNMVSPTRTKVTATRVASPTASATETVFTVVYITGMDDDISNDHFDAATIPTMTVNVSDAINPTYQWQRKKLGDSAFTNIDGATSSAYTPGNPATGEESYNFQNLYIYRCVVSATDLCDNFVDFEVAWGCGAKTPDDGWLNFMCHNLGANEYIDPFTPHKDIHGAKYKFGAKKATLTMSDDQTISSTIDQWTDTSIYPCLSKGAWNTPANNPCPSGYRVPYTGDWANIDNGTLNPSTVPLNASWKASDTNYTSGRLNGAHLFLPSAGDRNYNNGGLTNRGYRGYYHCDSWFLASTEIYYIGQLTPLAWGIVTKHRANSVRCVKQ
jgi:hypothetical protein